MVSVLLLIIVGLVLVMVKLYRDQRKLQHEYREYRADESERKQAAQVQSVKQSRATTLGNMLQHIAPYFPDFGYHPKDVQWVGGLFDFIIFDGRSEENIERVVLMDVKAGTSQLNKQQRQLRNAVQAGKVEFKIYRMPIAEAKDKDVAGELAD